MEVIRIRAIRPNTRMPSDTDFRRVVLPSRTLPAPRFRYSPVVQAGPFVFVSGLVGLDAATGALAAGGAYGQTGQILRNLGSLVDEMGWSMSQLLVARVFCAGVDVAADVNRAWDEAFADVLPPARTFVGVSSLPLGAAVEIEFQFLVGESQAG
jgi:2-iminobutanoate/2-iminopropanoate deaminase